MKRPSFQFYPGDWQRDAALRMVSVAARGLWIEMICIMHQGTPYGHLKVNGKAITNPQLGRMVGANDGEVENWLKELEEAGVFLRNSEGIIFSKRMVEDEEKREIKANGGKEGGNPALVGTAQEPGFIYLLKKSSDNSIKVCASKSPSKQLYKTRQKYTGDFIEIIAQKPSGNMAEDLSHIDKKYQQEWVILSNEELRELIEIHLKENKKEKVKVTPTPSSSSSSSNTSNKEKNTSYSPQLTSEEVEFEEDDEDLTEHKSTKVPLKKVLEAYSRICKDVLPIPRVFTKATQKNVRQRFLWVKKDKGFSTDDQVIEWFEKFFTVVSKNDWLCGRAEQQKDRNWRADFAWLMTERKFNDVISNKFANHQRG